MSKKSDLECPNCGSANPATIKPGEFRCQFCDTVFVNEAMMQRQRAAEKQANRLKAEELKANAQVEHAKAATGMSKRALLVIVPVLLAVFGYVAYMGMKSMEDTKKQQEELMKSLQNSAEEIKKDTVK